VINAMYAILRQFEYDSSKLAEAGPALEKVRTLHERQSGYAGSLLINDRQRLIAVNLWSSEQAAIAGREAIGAEVQQLLEPFIVGASELIATGEVLSADPHMGFGSDLTA
jgi:hypothetical protein